MSLRTQAEKAKREKEAKLIIKATQKAADRAATKAQAAAAKPKPEGGSRKRKVRLNFTPPTNTRIQTPPRPPTYSSQSVMHHLAPPKPPGVADERDWTQ